MEADVESVRLQVNPGHCCASDDYSITSLARGSREGGTTGRGTVTASFGLVDDRPVGPRRDRACTGEVTSWAMNDKTHIEHNRSAFGHIATGTSLSRETSYGASARLHRNLGLSAAGSANVVEGPVVIDLSVQVCPTRAREGEGGPKSSPSTSIVPRRPHLGANR
jgi:hypothetical protein